MMIDGTFITAVGGAVVGVLGFYRSIIADKRSAKSAESAREVSNFQVAFDSQTAIIKDIKEELQRVKVEQSEERKLWAAERELWARERKQLEDRIEEVSRESAKKDKTIADLKSQVSLLSKQLQSYQVIQDKK